MDVNVPMYAAGKSNPYKDACAWVLTEVAQGRMEAVIDTEIIQEILYRYSAINQWQVGAQMAQNLIDLIPVVLPVTVQDMQRAILLFTTYAPQGVKARDVIHAAVMQSYELTHIISSDKHFDRIGGIVRVDPQELFAGR